VRCVRNARGRHSVRSVMSVWGGIYEISDVQG